MSDLVSIALAGLDAETGVIMLLYLDQAWDKFRAAGRLNSMAGDWTATLHYQGSRGEGDASFAVNVKQ